MNVPKRAPYILGIGHRARIGKDTMADWLVQNCGYTKLRWSDEIYAEVSRCSLSLIGDYDSGMLMINHKGESFVFNKPQTPRLYQKVWEWVHDTPPDHFEVFVKEVNGTVAVRYEGMKAKDARLLQWWGTDFRRSLFGDQYWVKKVVNAIDTETERSKVEDTYNRFVIPDTRFPNEVDACREWGGRYCNISRCDGPVYDTGRDSDHISETALDNYEPDFDISSDGTLEEYTERLSTTFNHWRI